MQPAFEYGTEVRVTRNVRNDGTYPGKEVGELLVRRGAVGCIYDVGSYLQDQIIYRVHFLDEAKTVGCREEELILASDPWISNKFEFNQKVISKIPIATNGETVVEKDKQGTVVKVLRDSEKAKVSYHVYFGNHTFLMPEAALAEFSE